MLHPDNNKIMFLMSFFHFQYNGKRGYGPKDMLRENKKFLPTKNINTIVPTEMMEFNKLCAETDTKKKKLVIVSVGGVFLVEL